MRHMIGATLVLGLTLCVSINGQRGQVGPPPCQPVDAQPPRSAVELIGIAGCWDSRYAFGEAERAIAAAIVATEAQISSATDEVTGGPAFVGGNIAMPAMANKVKGEYPEKAAARGITGTVIVQVALKADGSVEKAEVVDSIPELDAAALATVKKMRFARTLIAGKPATVSFYVPARFGLADEFGPGDWLTLAQSYLAHGHPAAAAQALGLALDLERSDVKRFGPSLRRVGERSAGPGTITEPRRVKNVNPTYPSHALNTKAQGTVIIEALIDLNGKVGRARVMRSTPGFDVEALNAVRQWIYEPTLLDGKPVSVVLVVTVTFTIH